MREPALCTRDLTLSRGGVYAIRGLTWSAAPGGIAWVVGENGSGKSTLLRALAGRLRPARGQLRLPAARGPGPAAVWYHPDMRPPPEARVRDWDRLIAVLAPTTAEPSLRPAGLDARRPLGRLSTGEKKRLLLEPLLRVPAPLYLLDEPYEHLSPAAKARLTRRLQVLARRSIVVVASNQGAVAERRAPPGESILRLLGGGAWRAGSA